MSSVHIELAKKNAEKVQAIETYKKMDQERENIITELIDTYNSSNTFDLTKLNQWTSKMNSFAIKNQIPPRKIISKEMFLNYVNSIEEEM